MNFCVGFMFFQGFFYLIQEILTVLCAHQIEAPGFEVFQRITQRLDIGRCDPAVGEYTQLKEDINLFA